MLIEKRRKSKRDAGEGEREYPPIPVHARVECGSRAQPANPKFDKEEKAGCAYAYTNLQGRADAAPDYIAIALARAIQSRGGNPSYIRERVKKTREEEKQDEGSSFGRGADARRCLCYRILSRARALKASAFLHLLR